MENTVVKQLADRFSSNWRNQPIWQCTIRKGKHDTRFPGKRKHITHLITKAISQHNLFNQSLTAFTILVCGNFTPIANIIDATIFPNKSLSQQRKKTGTTISWNSTMHHLRRGICLATAKMYPNPVQLFPRWYRVNFVKWIKETSIFPVLPHSPQHTHV